MSEKAHVLVVANRTAASDELLEALVQRIERGPARFFLVVPATPRGASWITDMNSAGGAAVAAEALADALTRWRGVGIECDGRVGDSDPLAAACDTAGSAPFDEAIVSTLPHHLSRWLHLDLPHKVGHATGLPTSHVRARAALAHV